MPPPRPPQLPRAEERPGTLLETDDDIREALHANNQGQRAVEKPTSPPKAPPPRHPGGNPYRPTLRPPTAILTVLDDGTSEGETVRIRADRFVLGRTEGDFLVPHDELISARHVEITRRLDGKRFLWAVTDLGSRNGLFVRVSRAALADRAEILVGGGRYRFEAAGASQPTVDHLPSEEPYNSTRSFAEAGAPTHLPALVEQITGGEADRLSLSQSEYWIGGDPACAIHRPDDPFVEARHVRLYRDGKGAWHAQNNKTANGLWLRVPHVAVEGGCLFQIGEQRLRLNVGD